MLCELADSHDNTGYGKKYCLTVQTPTGLKMAGYMVRSLHSIWLLELSHLQTSIELWWQEVESYHEMAVGLGFSSPGLSELNASKLSECLNNQHPFTHRTYHSTDMLDFLHNYKRRQDSTTHKSRLFFFLLTSWLPSGVL